MKATKLLFASVLLSAGALAQTPPPAAGPADSAGNRQVTFETLDTNSDGRISSTEAKMDSALSAKFSSLDKAGRGYITRAEFQAYQRGADDPSSGARTPSN